MRSALARIVLLLSCWSYLLGQTIEKPRIVFKQVPPSDPGGPDRIEPIAGIVEGSCEGCRVILFAKGDVFYVQPWANAVVTTIQPDGSWKNQTHLGTQYAAVLAGIRYTPPATTPVLPTVGGDVFAVAVVDGFRARRPQPDTAKDAAPRVLRFSGFEWEVKESSGLVGPGSNRFGRDNVWVDADGHLHLLISYREDHWYSAEVINRKSLGYGTYSWEVADVSRLPVDTTLGLFTWDTQAPQYAYREIDLEAGRWSDPNNANFQCVVQPYSVSGHIARYSVPEGPMNHSFTWWPNQVVCRSESISPGNRPATAIERTLATGVPPAGGEHARMNLWLLGDRSRDAQSTEIVINRFEFRPLTPR